MPIPSITLPPLPEHLKVENCNRKNFLEAMKRVHANTWVTWKDGKTQFLIRLKSLKHSVYNGYSSKERVNLSRAAIYHLDRILNQADFDTERKPKEEERNVNAVYRYLIQVALNNKPEKFQIIIKNRNDVEIGRKNLQQTNVLYDLLNVEKETKAESSTPET